MQLQLQPQSVWRGPFPDHPLHPIHPLTLIHGRPSFRCDACEEDFKVNGSSFRCGECEFDLDVSCALSYLSDRGDASQWETTRPEQIALQHHPHPLISFSTRHEFVEDGACVICQEHVEGDGYMCLDGHREFLIHKGCIPNLYYADGTKTSSMAAKTLLQHPTHDHPLVPYDFSNDSIAPLCHLCRRKISADADAYACQGECNSYYYHRVCAEAPAQIDLHPLHPIHPLTLIHDRSPFRCDACEELFEDNGSSFRCGECDFDLGVSCALSSLSDRVDSSQLKTTTPEQIALLYHPHPLISFSTRHDFVGDGACVVCAKYVEGDGYMCLRRQCECLIHKGCIPDLYYADGTKAPRVFHEHPLVTFEREYLGSIRCAECESEDMSGEFIGCVWCEMIIHRDCIPVSEILLYPQHPKHILVLFMNCPDKHESRCGSCSSFQKGYLCYRCTSCEFFVHVGCALEVLAYREEGMNVEISLPFHEHKLLLCHMTKYGLNYCSYCEDESVGPTYACKENGCGFLLHKRCSEMETTIIHPNHPDHPLTIRYERGPWHRCKACCEPIFCRLNLSCKLCEFYLHAKCAARVPTRKHYLHEHELLPMDKAPLLECIRCGTSTDSPFLRCIPCDFNLHAKCMELPQVVKHDTHVHPLTLRESYVEDDSGEYYCDLCGQRRDGRLGVYVCEICKVTWAFQIECVLPELRKVYAKKSQTDVIELLAKQIAEKNEEIHAAKEKVEEMEQELDELVKRHSQLVFEEEKHYVTVTPGSKPEKSV